MYKRQLNRSKAKLVSGSLSQREYTGSKSIGTFTGADGGAFDTPFSGSTSYVQTLLTPSGSALQNYHNFEIAKIDGEFSGSLIIASSQSLSAGNSFTKESGLNLLFDIENFDASFICPFTVETFVPASPSPSITPTISNTPQVTPSNTPSISVTPSITVSKSITPTISVTPSITPSISGTPGVSVTPSISITPTISITIIGPHVSRHRRQSGGTKECGHSNPSIPQSEWFLHGAGQGFLSASTTLLAGAGHRSMGAFWLSLIHI